MKQFLIKKGIDFSFRTYFITGLSYMALGLFSSLIIGLIMQTAGDLIDFPLLVDMGTLAMSLMGPAIGAAVAYGLKAPRLVLFASIISGAAGVELGGGPAGAYVSAVISTEIGKLFSQSTKVDIIVTPFMTIASGFLAAKFVGPVIQSGMTSLGSLIMWGTEQQPFFMGIIVATLMGLALTAPISSAAIGIMLGLEGLAAGAATIGCCAQMIGFAISSFRENKFSGLIAIGIGTSMLLVPNIIKNPKILIPPTLAGIILAPIGTIIFQMTSNPEGSGMGTSGLVGQIMTFTTMGFTFDVLLKVLLLHFVGPAFISLVISEWMRKKGWIQLGDMKIDQ